MKISNSYKLDKRISALIIVLMVAAFSVACASNNENTAAEPSQGLPLMSWSELDTSAAPEVTEFLFFGDIQPEGSLKDYDEVFGKLLNAAYKAHPDVQFGLQVGDIGNIGDSYEEWGKFKEVASPVFGNIPLLTAIGNHEITPYAASKNRKPLRYLEKLKLPENGPAGFEEEFYSVEYGQVHITVLSSNYMDSAEPYSDDPAENREIMDAVNRWIEDDLAGTDKPHKIVMMHHPAFPISSDTMTPNIQDEWVPIFERTGVELLLVGDQHEYMRTKPWMNGAGPGESGMVQIMEVSSAKAYPEGGGGIGYIEVEIAQTPGYLYIKATSDKISATAYDMSGNVIDKWED
jgi:hypothetical protein